MTLNITIATVHAVYQSADHRLSDVDTKTLISSQSSKNIEIRRQDWSGLLTYTGIGRWQGRDTHEFIHEWIATISNCSIDEFAEQVRRHATSWLKTIPESDRVSSHIFTLATIDAHNTSVRTIEWERPKSGNVTRQLQFTINTHLVNKDPKLLITGCSAAVSGHNKSLLKRIARDPEIDPRGSCPRHRRQTAASPG